MQGSRFTKLLLATGIALVFGAVAAFVAALNADGARADPLVSASLATAPAGRSQPDGFVGLSFEYADYTMGYGRTQPGPPALVSTIKLMQAGFTEVIDTEAMFARAFAEMQAKKLLPPP